MLMKTLLNLVLVITILSVNYKATAQSDVALATKQSKLQALSDKLKKRDVTNRRLVEEFADRVGIPVRRELSDGKVLELQRVSPDNPPIFYITNNSDAADTVSTEKVWPGGSAGLNLDGSGMTVGEWDGGAIFADHWDFIGRVTQVDGATLVSGHSTHVAGTLIGSGEGLEPRSRGMAYAAQLNAWDWNSDTAEMASAAADGLLLSNHSYGIAAGWLYIGAASPNTWWWIGGAEDFDVEDPYFGYYDAQSQLWDQIAFDAPYYLIVKAAGNDRSDIGPSAGEEYTVIDQSGNPLFTSTLPRNADCTPVGYDCLPGNSVAKNVLLVGAVDNVPGGYSPLAGPSQVLMTPFSGWGPTDDGRIKPDVVGNGLLVLSAWPDYQYAVASGTSMAAPNVTGSLLLLQEHYEDIHGTGNFMRSATVKALAIHTADEAGDADGPDYAFGWGLLNTRIATEVITEDGGGDHQIIESSLADGAENTIQFEVTQSDSILTATLVWMDPPGTPGALTLDSPTLMLKNDLDLRITRSPSTYLPWVLDPATPAAAATKGDNFRDNVEQVEVAGGGTGTYTIKVSHKGTLLNNANQNYSLIISSTPAPLTGSSLLINENFSNGLPAGWSVETISGVNWTFNLVDNGTGGSGQFAMVDNQYNLTNTSLQTHTLDLSTATAVVLRFKSYFLFDLLESINVDISTDGGTSWSNAWQFQGFALPSLYTLDLSGALSGQANVKLRFRFDSGYDNYGNLWQIDDVELEVFGSSTPPGGDSPGQATNPSPANGSSEVGLSTIVSWSVGSLATSHNVYFGTDSTPDENEFQGNQTGTSFDPGTLANATTYYWHVDEVNSNGTTQGITWNFTTEAAAVPTDTIHLANLSGSMTPSSRGQWNAVVNTSVVEQDNGFAAGVTVYGNWSTGGSEQCVTDSGGLCSVTKSNIKKQVKSVTFTVTNLTRTGTVYSSADNVGSSSITVSQVSTDQTPSATNDSYQTNVDTAVSGNVISNDDQGDGPASISSNTQPSNGSLNLSSDGAFTYTPNVDYEGTDSFTYNIVDQDGDISNTANAYITVSTAPSNEPSVNLRPFKVKGIQHVEVTWLNFSGATVNIQRDNERIVDGTSGGLFVDNIGVKGGGQIYTYEVCEIDGSNCANAVTGF